ncbi:conjugal transfer protein TraG N-terminal domain-containing protein [Aliarcobacter lanthieri]|uniref:conjugal transfer protein TraG N-terminal domain-containing protein n=1 Tax=Aliarcobacter lanthieri TaxID=1355374 RepID=UPI00047A4F53|nr:conjugal transfer protein TraG N-terminal domain-containing protein [Aliarcobacter lanthieri]QKF59286.1 F-type type IV conjugative transfer system protein TraG [Aliarcobacter lanthieri]
MIKKIILLSLLFSGYLFAVETTYAWGYGDLLVETLKMVKYVFSINEFKDIWKVAVLVSMIAAVISMLFPNPDYFKIPKVFFFSMLIWTIFATARIDVYVDDKVDNNNSGLIRDVPWAVGWPLSLFSTLEYRLGVGYEVATSIPNGMKYSNSGFLTPISIFKQSTGHNIITPFIFTNLNNYIHECVMPDLENGYKDYKTLVDSENVWAYMGNTSPATFMLYSDSDNNTSLQTCPNVYVTLNTALQNYVGVGGEGMESLGKSLGLLSGAAISSQLGVANQYLLGTSKTASQMLLQSTAINTFSESFRNYTLMNGADLNNTAFHSASASQAAAAQMIVSGVLGSRYIPVIKGILTSIIMGLTPILALMMVTPMFWQVLKGYIMILAWLSFWHLGDTILNHIIITKTQTALSSYGDVKFNTIGMINSTTTDYVNMAASMYWTIPTIALLIVTGFSLAAFASLNNAMTTKLDRTASAVGGDMGKGNMSFGNVGHNSYSANNVSALASQTMGNSTEWRDNHNSFKSGNEASRVNNLSQSSGTQAMTGGIAGNESFNNLMGGMGNNLDFNNITGNSQAAGKDINGNQIYQATSAMTLGGNGVNGTLASGGRYTQDKDGKVSLIDAQLEATKSDGTSIVSKFKGGIEQERTMTDLNKNTMESTTMENGIDKSFKWTSGQDSGTLISGIYKAKSNQISEITDAKISGSDLSKTDSGMTTYSLNDVRSSLSALGRQNQDTKTNSIQEQEQDSKTKESSTSDSKQESTKGSITGQASVGLSTPFGGAKVTAAAEKAIQDGHTEVSLDKNSNTITFSGGKTEAQTYTVSNSDMDQLQSSFGKQTSNSSGINASRDVNPERVKEIANNALANGENLNDVFKSIVGNKDTYHSGSIKSTANEAPVYVNRILEEQKPSRNFSENEISSVDKKELELKNQGSTNENNKIIDKALSSISADGTIKNPDGDSSSRWSNGGNKVSSTPRDLVYKLEENGVLTYNRTSGNSTINDWNSIQKLEKEEIKQLIDFNDWGKNTNNRLNELYQQKPDGSNFKTDANSGDIDQANKGLVDVTKTMEVKKNQNNQPVEQVKEK